MEIFWRDRTLQKIAFEWAGPCMRLMIWCGSRRTKKRKDKSSYLNQILIHLGIHAQYVQSLLYGWSAADPRGSPTFRRQKSDDSVIISWLTLWLLLGLALSGRGYVVLIRILIDMPRFWSCEFLSLSWTDCSLPSLLIATQGRADSLGVERPHLHIRRVRNILRHRVLGTRAEHGHREGRPRRPRFGLHRVPAGRLQAAAGSSLVLHVLLHAPHARPRFPGKFLLKINCLNKKSHLQLLTSKSFIEYFFIYYLYSSYELSAQKINCDRKEAVIWVLI